MSLTFKMSRETAKDRLAGAVCARSAARGARGILGKRRRKRRTQDPGVTGGHPAPHARTITPGRSLLRRFSLRFWAYFYKMRGRNPATHDFSFANTAWSFFGAFAGMLVLALVNIQIWERQEQGLLLGSFGASAMLVFGAPHAPFAQPRNVIGGHVVSALAGVFAQQLAGGEPWLAAALAVALAVTAMHLTATLHPPGGATALIAVVGSSELKQFGYAYALYPVGLSMAAMVAVGILLNNMSKKRHYPVYWW